MTLARWAVLALVFFIALLASFSNYQAGVIEQQRHTIQQLQGLEDGPDATPQPLVPPKGTEAPKSFIDQRRWQRSL